MMLWLVVSALAGDRPDRVELTPNGVLRVGDPLRVRVPGVPANSGVQLLVLRDCNGDGRPELKDLGGCHSPVWRGSATAGDGGVAEATVPTTGLPTGVTLVARARTNAGLADAHFWLDKTDAPTSTFSELRRLLDYLRHQGSSATLKERSWELRRFDVAANSDAVVPGGERVTGFAVDKRGAVVLTRPKEDGAELVRLAKGAETLLYAEPKGDLGAPAVAANGQVFVVATTGDRVELGRVVNKGLTATVPLELAPDALQVVGKEIVGTTYGTGGIEVFGLDRKTGARADVADVPAALEQAWTAGDLQIVNYEDTSGQNGRDVAIVKDGVPTLVPNAKGDEVLPQLGPDGAIYYMAEVKP